MYTASNVVGAGSIVEAAEVNNVGDTAILYFGVAYDVLAHL